MSLIVTFSTRFPKSHPRHGELTNFVNQIYDGQKIHTCRQHYDYWAEKISRLKKSGGYLSLRTWTGKPYASPQAEIMHVPAEVVGVQRLTLTRETNFGSDMEWRAMIEDKEIDITELAKNDGLSESDFKAWFDHLLFTDFAQIELAIIHFTKFRY